MCERLVRVRERRKSFEVKIMTENDFSRYFHFKAFPPLSHTHKSLTHARPLSSLHCSDPHTKPNGTIHTDAPRSRSRRSPKLRRSTSIMIAIAPIVISRSTLHAIAIAPIGVDRDHRNQRDCDRDLTDRRFARSRSHRENMLSF